MCIMMHLVLCIDAFRLAFCTILPCVLLHFALRFAAFLPCVLLQIVLCFAAKRSLFCSKTHVFSQKSQFYA